MTKYTLIEELVKKGFNEQRYKNGLRKLIKEVGIFTLGVEYKCGSDYMSVFVLDPRNDNMKSIIYHVDSSDEIELDNIEPIFAKLRDELNNEYNAALNDKKCEPINKIHAHDALCCRIHDLYVKKNADYGDSVGDLYKRLGDVSFLTRISDKYNRLMNLMTDYDGYMRSDIDVNYESIDDTIMDLANYCIIWLMERELKNKGEN